MLDSAIFRFEMDPAHVPQLATRRSRLSQKDDNESTSQNIMSVEETKQSDVSSANGIKQHRTDDHLGPIVKIVNEAQFVTMMEEKVSSR